MIKIFLTVIFLSIISFKATAMSYREFKKLDCWIRGGIQKDEKVCDDGYTKKTYSKQCYLGGESNHAHRTDGCTFSSAYYGFVFHKACIAHDNCYHHEPATNGLNRRDCDLIFYDNMMTICRAKNNFYGCKSMANSFYYSVRIFGQTHYTCANQERPYKRRLSPSDIDF